MNYSKEEILNWIDNSNKRLKSINASKEELYLCPKSDKCIMDCSHKKPHTFDDFCDPESRTTKEAYGDNPCECPKCVKELAADITFFEEDFEI
jgi:hypothetical protein